MSVCKTLLSLIFPLPDQCAVCGNRLNEGETYLCESCQRQIKKVYEPTCVRCGRPLGSLTSCPQCSGRDFYFTRSRSWGIYEGVLREAIHQFKFNKKPYLGEFFATCIVDELLLCKESCVDIIVPVPLHSKRLMKRGFNQAEVLAEELAKHMDCNWVNALARIRHTKPQAGLTAEERVHTVQGCFRVVWWARKSVKGKRALLIDDVFTTGSTVNECSKVLLEAGAQEVQVLTVATAVKYI